MPSWTNEQLDAINKSGSNIIVSAGAGSGKTAVLTERVVEKLKKGIHIDELLILTFTRAAADEMKARIRKKIGSNELLKDELKILDSAYITTFDSYALSILKKYHYLLNIPKNIKICDESILEIKSKEIFDEVFDNLYLNGDDTFFKLINKYCLKNDTSLRKSIFDVSKKIDNLVDRDEYLEYLKNGFYSNDKFDFFLEELNNIFKGLLLKIKNEFDNLKNCFDDKYLDKVYESICGLYNLESIFDFQNFGPVSFPNVPKGTSEEAKSVKENFKKTIDDLYKLQKYSDREYLKNSFNENYKNALSIINVLGKYYEKLDLYKELNYIYSFTDVAKKSIYILKKYPNIATEIRNSLNEIMIDEYQDTNDIQEEFISLISNNNVYMVGDVKQSIYRFRGANPSIFRNRYNEYENSKNGIKIDLNKNFRSRCEVINGINEIFSLLMSDDIGGANYIETHQMIFGNNNYSDKFDKSVNYNFSVLEYNRPKDLEYSNEEIEIFTIAQDIKNKIIKNVKVFDKNNNEMRTCKYSDFVVILDRSKYFDLYKKIFEYFDIPLEILKDGVLNYSSDLSIIKNLVELVILIHNNITNIDFKYDFMSVGRSFLYEYGDQYLFDVISSNSWEETTLYKDIKNIKNYNSKTASELFEELLDITDFYNKINKVGNYEDINVRIEKVDKISKDLNDLNLSFEELKDYLDKTEELEINIKYATAPSSTDSVKILTIHKSKGLEYPFCYFADLSHTFNNKDTQNNFISTKKYGLITPLLDLEDDSSFIKYLYLNDYYVEEVSEKIRLLYVALTRAREKAIVVLPYSEEQMVIKNINGTIESYNKIKVNSLGELFSLVKRYLGNYYCNINLEDLKLSKDYLYNKKINELVSKKSISSFDVNEISIESNIVNSKHFSKELSTVISNDQYNNINFGTYIHEVMEYMDFKDKNIEIIEEDNIKNLVLKFMNLRELENIDKANIYHEYEFHYEQDGSSYHGIIDLMLEYENEIKIIDFKTKNIKNENYNKQLTGYANYIKTKTSKEISIYLYSIVDNNLEKLGYN